MPYRLNFKQTCDLVAQPETGMGYQYVNATMNDSSSLAGVVLNAEIFIPKNRIEKIIGRGFLKYSSILQEAERPGYIRELRVIGRNSLELGESKFFKRLAGIPAAQAPISFPEREQKFKRFSPYTNDHRVTSDHGLLPGSYATTEKDARNVGTGTEATLRYALPSDEPAIYVFTISPPEKTSIQIGTVQPANGKPGGGVEVIFENGSPKTSVTGPITIPTI